jgi:hypothetical protein
MRDACTSVMAVSFWTSEDGRHVVGRPPRIASCLRLRSYSHLFWGRNGEIDDEWLFYVSDELEVQAM